MTLSCIIRLAIRIARNAKGWRHLCWAVAKCMVSNRILRSLSSTQSNMFLKRKKSNWADNIRWCRHSPRAAKPNIIVVIRFLLTIQSSSWRSTGQLKGKRGIARTQDKCNTWCRSTRKTPTGARRHAWECLKPLAWLSPKSISGAGIKRTRRPKNFSRMNYWCSSSWLRGSTRGTN
jgi:hypothetical protein